MVVSTLLANLWKKCQKRPVFDKIVSVPSRNPREALRRPSDHSAIIVGANWQLINFVPIGAVFVEKLTKNFCPKGSEKRPVFRKLLEVPEHLSRKVGEIYSPLT